MHHLFYHNRQGAKNAKRDAGYFSSSLGAVGALTVEVCAWLGVQSGRSRGGIVSCGVGVNVGSGKLIVVLAWVCACGGTSLVQNGDAGAPVDSGDSEAAWSTKDGGKDIGDEPRCPVPADLTGFSPGVPTPPHAADKTACPSGAYQAFSDACYGHGATAQTCQTWSSAEQKCASCIESQESSSQWGLVVEGNGIAWINIAACLALVGEVVCASAYATLRMCEEAGCARCLTDPWGGFQTYPECVSHARAGGCKAYADAQKLACSPDAASKIDMCTSDGGFGDCLVKLGPVFCGP